MDDIALPHDIRVEDILADYFTKKIEGKDTESKGKASESQHSSKSKKSKKRKHKKKKKHKSRKAHSESEQEEKHSSDDDCWVEVTAKGGDLCTKDGEDTQPQLKSDARDQKQPGVGGATGQLATETSADKVPKSPPPPLLVTSKERSPALASSADSENSPEKNINGESINESSTKTSKEKGSKEGAPKKVDCSKISDRSGKDSRASASGNEDNPSDEDSSPKKQGKKKRRSYRTKRCRSSGSSSEEPDEMEEKKKGDSRTSPFRKSTQKDDDHPRARHDSRSRRNSRGSRERRERSVSRGRIRQQRRSPIIEARDRKRSRASRSHSPGHSRNSRSRSRDRKQPSRRSRTPKPASRHSRSPRHFGRRSRSPRQSRDRPVHRQSRDRPIRRQSRDRRSRSRNLSKRSRSRSRNLSKRSRSRSRNLSKRSQSRGRNRSCSAKRSRSSRSRSQRRSRRSESCNRRCARRSSSQKHPRSPSQKRSPSGRRSDLRHSTSRSSSREVFNKSSEKGKERSSSHERKAGGRDTPNDKSVVDNSSLDITKVPESNERADSTNDDKNSSSKNQVVLYGPFEEEEDATFLDEESSPDRALPSGVAKPPSPKETAVHVTNDLEIAQEGHSSPVCVENVPAEALEHIKYPDPETILLPGESPTSGEDVKPTRAVSETCEAAVEDMDISNSPLSGGVLEVEETFSSSYEAAECVYQPSGISRSFYDSRGTVQDAQIATSGLFTELHVGEPPVKPEGLWGFSDSRQQQRVKIDLNKPVGQVKPILREKNILETPEAPKENVVQTKLEDTSPAKAQFHHVSLGSVAEQRALLPVAAAAVGAQTVYVLETAMGEAKLSRASPVRSHPGSGEGTKTPRVSGAGCFSAVPLQYDEPKQRDSESEQPPGQTTLQPMVEAYSAAQSQIPDHPVEATIGNRSASGGEQSEKFSTLSYNLGKVTAGGTATKEALHHSPSIVVASGDETSPQQNDVSLPLTSEQTKASTDYSFGNREAQELTGVSGLSSGLSSGGAGFSTTNDLAVADVSSSSTKTNILGEKHRERILSRSKSRSPYKSKSRSLSKDRLSRSQSKDKSRSLSKDRRGRSHSKGSRSRSKDRKSRSRSRGKKRSRKERSRSKEKQRSKRSRSRQRRSRSRQRSRSQSRGRKRPRRSLSRTHRRSSKNRSESRERQRSPCRRSASKSPRRSRSKQRQKSRSGRTKGRDKSSKKRSRSKEKKKSRRSHSKERKSSKKGKHSKEKSSKKKSSRCKGSSSPDRKDDQKSDVESSPQKSDSPATPPEKKLHVDDKEATSVEMISDPVQDIVMKSEECTVSPHQVGTAGKEGFLSELGKQLGSVTDEVTVEPQPEVISVNPTELPAENKQKTDPMAELDDFTGRQSGTASSQQTDLAVPAGSSLDHSVTITPTAPNLGEVHSASKSGHIEKSMELIDKACDEALIPPNQSFSDANQASDDKSAQREEPFAEVKVDPEELASTDVSQVGDAPSSKDLDEDRPRQSDNSPIDLHNESDTISKLRSRSSSMSKSPSLDRSKDRTDSRSRKKSPSPEKRKHQRSRSLSLKRRSRSREKKRSRSRGKDKSRSPEKRSRSREKKRSRSREKKRSRSREKKRSRSREKKRSRSREKKRSRSREKKRSRSREKKRSRSREKKRSRSRDRRSRSRDKKRSRSRDRKRSKSREKKRSRSREKRRSRSKDKKRSRSRDKRRSRSRDKKRSRSREKRRSRDRKNSRSRSRDKRRSRSRERKKSRSRDRIRSRSRDRKRSRSRIRSPLRRKSRSRERLLRRRSLSRRRSPIRKKSRSRSRRRSRSRSSERRRLRKSRSREREPSVVKVDKAQLLEAARKNMQAMLQRGVVAKGLPVAAAAAVNATVKVVAAAVAAAAADPSSSLAATLAVSSTPPSTSMAPAAMPVTMAEAAAAAALPATRTTGEEQPKVKKSLAALTDICKAISEEEKREYAGEVEPKTADEVAQEFHETHHHPFKLKDPPPPIRFNIPNATNLPIKTLAEKVADAAHLHKQFPVSSGNQHRVKELEWVPVEKPDPPQPLKPKAGKAARTRQDPDAVGIAKSPPRPLPSLPPAPAHNTFSPLPTIATPPVFQVEEESNPRQRVSVAVVPPTPKAVVAWAPATSGDTDDLVNIMKRRVEALKALKKNPMDLEAMKVYHDCHKQFQAWAQSKHEPGQYTGSIDFKPLTPDELSGPNPAWVKKDQFVRAAPVCEGIGMHLLKKMGWTPGEGLGKNKEGCLEPLLPSIKTDKKGLVSDQELRRPAAPAHHDLGGKHPVSALTEFCLKSRWGPPEFVLVNESGPDHKKTFLFKVKVNGLEFLPSERSANKKHAKAQAAMLCLQKTGVIGRSTPGPFTSSGTLQSFL